MKYENCEVEMSLEAPVKVLLDMAAIEDDKYFINVECRVVGEKLLMKCPIVELNTKTMKYRLKKDTPYHKAGKILTREKNLLLDETGRGYDVDRFIDNLAEWFEEYHEAPSWTDEDMIKFLSTHSHLSYEGAKEKLKILKENI